MWTVAISVNYWSLLVTFYDMQVLTHRWRWVQKVGIAVVLSRPLEPDSDFHGLPVCTQIVQQMILLFLSTLVIWYLFLVCRTHLWKCMIILQQEFYTKYLTFSKKVSSLSSLLIFLLLKLRIAHTKKNTHTKRISFL